MKYCKFLNEGINFHLKGMSFCNKLWNANGYIPYEANFFEKFLEKRQNIIESIKNNNLEFNCDKCVYFEDKDLNDIDLDSKIKTVEIYHWEECNCGCFYCSNRKTTKLKINNKRNNKGRIDVLPYLKKLKELDLLDDSVFMSLVGGEPTVLKEFPDLLKFFIKNNYKTSILSNGILYEKLINKLLILNNESTITISLDCGTRETFKKIKKVDKFNDVVKNIKKYIKDSKNSSDRVVVKYIILEGINDSKEEIDKWIDLCVKLGVTHYFPSIEFCHYANDESKQNISEHICELYDYIKTRIKEINPNFQVSTYDFVETFIKNRSYKTN